ncbi:hypothetical protein [Elioraea sp.]|uniref:hypothetical protein n=1 Tax=Elioraea sp. TaxID=2185103 RepID=UPI0025BED607|nr:hypothetical protein [Elioraea sp.]
MIVAVSFGPAVRHLTTPAEAARFFAAAAENGAARRVLLLRPTKLPGWPASVEAITSLRRTLEPVLALPGLVWNDLPDGDGLAIWRRGGEAEVGSVQAAMAATPGVAAVFDVPEDLASLQLALAAIAAEHGHAPPAVVSGRPAKPVTLDDIAAVERVLERTELLDRLSVQPVFSFGEGGEKTLAMRSLRLDLQALLDALVPGRALSPEPRLRARFARAACRRLLAQLAQRHEIASNGTIAVPMDVSTILSPGFGRFDDALPARLRGRIILKLSFEQAVADVTRFTAAARIAAAADVPVCLARIRPEHLPGVAPLAAGATWIRLSGTAALAPETVRAAIPTELLPRVIIADVAAPASLAVLRAGGVGMFSGPAADAA